MTAPFYFAQKAAGVGGNPMIVGGQTPRITQLYTRPGDATQYSIGDNIANTTTGANVLPIVFDIGATGRFSGRISGARCVVSAASGTIVLPEFDLYIFRADADIPFAAGSYPADNAPLNISTLAMKQIVAVFPFSASSWRNQAGAAAAAGDHVYQDVAVSPRQYAPFNIKGLTLQKLHGLMQAKNAWNPGNVSNIFDFALDVDLD